MANIMTMKDIKNKPSRNGFDLSSRINFTAKVGELLPVWYKEVLPGDKFKINLKSFTRTQPVNTAAQARMVEYYDFYFVPFSQLWNKFDTVVTQMNSNGQHAMSLDFEQNKFYSGDFPNVSFSQIATYLNWIGKSKDSFGFSRGLSTCKLLQYLRYGDFRTFSPVSENYVSWSSDPLSVNLKCNIFPLLAYQKIYADYFRYTQWESSSPSTFNVDYIKGTDDLNLSIDSLKNFRDNLNFFDMRYCNYQKDLFHGVLPVAQYGSASVVPINGGLSVQGIGSPLFQFSGTDFYPNIDDAYSPLNAFKDESFSPSGAFDSGIHIRGHFNNPSGTAGSLAGVWKDPKLKVIADNISFNVPVLALRQAEFLQKWKEVALFGEEDYKSQIQKH